MLQHIKDLLQSAQLRKKISATASQAEAIKLLLIASAEKGYNVTSEGVSQMLAELIPAQPGDLSEQELLSVTGAGGAHTTDVASCFGCTKCLCKLN